MPKISLIITTKNEASNITRLLESIASQTQKPDEIIIVDANSTDNTRALIKKTANQLQLPLRLLNKSSTRSQARNLAISRASYPIIAATDAGCILDKHWLKNITQPLIKDQADAVAGFYLPVTPTCFEKSVAPYVAIMPDQLDYSSFLPSSRSIAFTKNAWAKVGKYPQQLHYCEDLVFASQLKENTRLVVQPNAIVYWLQSTNFVSFFHQIKNYARGDIEALYAPHLKKIISVYLRYVAFYFFPALFGIYLIWPIVKHYRHVKHPGCLIYLPPLQLTADLAIVTGSLSGLVKKYRTFLPLPNAPSA